MGYFKKIAIGLIWAFVFFVLRNLSFQYDDIIVVLDSLALGFLVGKLPQRLWQWMVIVALALPLSDIPTILFNSTLPLLIAYFTFQKKQPWTFYLLYLLIPISMLGVWVYRSEVNGVEIEDTSSDELQLYPFQKGFKEAYQFSPDTTYFLSYWHLGCSACIRQDRSLRIFAYRHKGEALKVLSVYLGDTTNRRFQPSLELYHQDFPNFYDRNQMVQKKFQQNVGPALLLIKDGEPCMLWRGFTFDSWREYFMQFYWDQYLED
ncbi:thioredoxin domain-containing protein [Croceimicrobium hydrocarbonivorans]|uniref:Uncharacterized protein n=1 Tax=Croceimicrobium hydrocarbonivorans TaxID=2761580 RepID=A0A7H0VAS3_9FLAO|nr:hypothetical protein [Croceimicrobium hydrocarbonivorans]QNR22821.1 hypothetical protein H4K34_10560 [Croceimicrobium hydrocarbonivorans]